MFRTYLANKSITVKVILFLSALSVLMLGSSFFVYKKQLSDFDNYNQTATEAVASMFKLAVTDYIVTGDSESLLKNVNNSIDEGLIYGIAIFSPNGGAKLVYPDNIDLNIPAVEVVVDNISPNDSSKSYYKIFVNQTLIENARFQFKLSATIFIICLILTIFLIAAFLNKHLVKPLLKLSSSAKNIAEGKYDFDVEINTKDEIGILTSALSEMAHSLNARSIKEAGHLKAIVKAHGEIAMESQDRTKFLDALLSKTTPHLTEALVTLQSLSDRPIQHKMLNKIILFVMAQLEQARGMLDESDSLFKLDLEKVTIAEFSKVVNEYAHFFSAHKDTNIDFSFKYDQQMNVDGSFLLVDKKLLIKLFSLIFEIMNSKGFSISPKKSSVWLILDSIKDGVAVIEIIVRSDSCDLNLQDCQFINHYFSTNEALENEAEEFRSSTFNRLVFTGLKAITSSLKAQFQINMIGEKIESRFHCKVLTCQKEESLEERMARYHSNYQQSAITLVGDKRSLYKMNMYQHIISVVDYDTFLLNSNAVNQESHYVIDFIHDFAGAKKSAMKLRAHGLNERNFVLLIEEKYKRDDFIEYSYEVGADMIITDSINSENVSQITTNKRSEKVKDSISQIFESIIADSTRFR